MAIEDAFDVTVAPLEVSKFFSIQQRVTVPRAKGIG
jgi:hypothetical protein